MVGMTVCSNNGMVCLGLEFIFFDRGRGCYGGVLCYQGSHSVVTMESFRYSVVFRYSRVVRYQFEV